MPGYKGWSSCNVSGDNSMVGGTGECLWVSCIYKWVWRMVPSYTATIARDFRRARIRLFGDPPYLLEHHVYPHGPSSISYKRSNCSRPTAFKRTRTLSEKWMKHNSHLLFIRASLRNNQKHNHEHYLRTDS